MAGSVNANTQTASIIVRSGMGGINPMKQSLQGNYSPVERGIPGRNGMQAPMAAQVGIDMVSWSQPS